MLIPFKPLDLSSRAMKKAGTESYVCCFCCRDSGLLPAQVVRRYLDPAYQTWDAPIACRAPGCDGNTVSIPNPDQPGKNKTVERFRMDPEVLDLRLTPDQCQRIHRAELDRNEMIRKEAEVGQTSPAFSIAQQVGGLANGADLDEAIAGPVVVEENGVTTVNLEPSPGVAKASEEMGITVVEKEIKHEQPQPSTEAQPVAASPSELPGELDDDCWD